MYTPSIPPPPLSPSVPTHLGAHGGPVVLEGGVHLVPDQHLTLLDELRRLTRPVGLVHLVVVVVCGWMG